MKSILSILLVLSLSFSFGQNDCLLEQKAPNTLVIDQADILNASEEKLLVQKLIQFNRETSNQILVVTVENLCGYDKAEFTYSLGEKWGVGQKGFDNGIVLMVKPYGGKGQRHTFIAVGYGLEGAIPDATAKRIVEAELMPHFKQGDFVGGINAGVSTLMGLAKGEINAANYNKSTSPKVPIFPILFILFIIFLTLFSSVQRARKYSLGHDVTFWAALWLLSSTSHRRGGGWGNFNSGGGSFGGGFGGFGGGSFGGGGAGGSW